MTVHEHAIDWLRAHSSLSDQLLEEAIAWVPTIPPSRVGMPFCKACESVLCGACHLCHSLDLLVWDPPCPLDCDTMGRDCAAWWQAFTAVITAQQLQERGP